jgi:hypothetical protein
MFYAIGESLLCVVATLIIASVTYTVWAAILRVGEKLKHGIRALPQAGGVVSRHILGRPTHSLGGRETRCLRLLGPHYSLGA